MNSIPLLFILGPSGVGKSCISKQLVSKMNFLLVDFDRQGGFDEFLDQWNRFRKQYDAIPLASIIRDRVNAAVRTGAALLLPSTERLDRKHIEVAKTESMQIVVLWGSKKLCMEAAISRPDVPVRNENQYDRNNRKLLDLYSNSDFDDVKIEVFKPDNSRRSPAEIIQTILERKAALQS